MICIILSIVGARLNYCNSLLHGTHAPPASSACQNWLVHVITQTSHRTSDNERVALAANSPTRRVQTRHHRVQSYSIHTGWCLTSELHRHQSSRVLRSGASAVLHQSHASLDFHRHFFTVSAPAVWNNIAAAVCDSVRHF